MAKKAQISKSQFAQMVKTLPAGAVVETGAGLVANARPKTGARRRGAPKNAAEVDARAAAPKRTAGKKPAAKKTVTRKRADGTTVTLQELDGDKKEMLRGVVQRYAPELLPFLRSEYEFGKWLPKPRRWRFDWVIHVDPNWAELDIPPPTNQGIVGVAIEVDGGQWAKHGGRHARDSDRWKTNEASALGYLLLRFSPEMLDTDPINCLRQIRAACKMARILI